MKRNETASECGRTCEILNKVTLVQAEQLIVKKALHRLPDLERWIVELRFWENWTLEEISEFLGMEWDTVNLLLENALKWLRQLCKSETTQLLNMNRSLAA